MASGQGPEPERTIEQQENEASTSESDDSGDEDPTVGTHTLRSDAECS